MTLRAWVQENPGKAITAAAITGGTIVYVAFKILTGSGTGDEPPIRVKGGSVRIEMAAKKNSNKWDTVSNVKWKFKNGKRENDTYEVVVGMLPGAEYKNGTYATGKKVRATYSDNAWVEFESSGKLTTVTTSTAFVQPEDMVLEHEAIGGQGFINSVSVDGQPLCTFTAKEQLGAIVLLDY